MDPLEEQTTSVFSCTVKYGILAESWNRGIIVEEEDVANSSEAEMELWLLMRTVVWEGECTV